MLSRFALCLGITDYLLQHELHVLARQVVSLAEQNVKSIMAICVADGRREHCPSRCSAV